MRFEKKKKNRTRTIEAPVCATCGKAFAARRADARFCSAACKQRAHRKTPLGGPLVTDNRVSAMGVADSHFATSQPIEIIEASVTDNGGSTVASASGRAMRFETVDEVTVRLVVPDPEDPRNPLHVAWLLDVGWGHWHVRRRDIAAGPFTQRRARAVALALAQDRHEAPAVRVADPIEWLNRAAAAAVPRRDGAPVALGPMFGGKHVETIMTETEAA